MDLESDSIEGGIEIGDGRFKKVSKRGGEYNSVKRRYGGRSKWGRSKEFTWWRDVRRSSE